jgi:hypothetical protein
MILDVIRQVHSLGAKPRIHGNGFIQLDFSPSVRLHVWGPHIPRQKVDTPVHNHRFSFTSLVLRGSMINRRYEFGPPLRRPDYPPMQTHRIYIARARNLEDTVLQRTEATVALVRGNDTVIPMGHSYSMQAGEVHESIVYDSTVTVIMKDGPSLAQQGPTPTVYVPLDIEPDNSFDRYSIPENRLWAMIEEACK